MGILHDMGVSKLAAKVNYFNLYSNSNSKLSFAESFTDRRPEQSLCIRHLVRQTNQTGEIVD